MGSAILLNIALSYDCTAKVKQSSPVDYSPSINSRCMTIRTRVGFRKVLSRTRTLTGNEDKRTVNRKYVTLLFMV